MAVKAATFDRTVTPDESVYAVTWTALTFSGPDSGSPIQLAAWADKTFHVFGSFSGTANLVIEGSNDGTNWAPLSNRQGTSMNFLAAGLNTSQDKPIWVRPRVTAGDGSTSLTVIVACHRSDIAV